ncbi:MAG: nucleotidyl transferase AbiEii/AbiGii toxin family protein [Bacteroidales bacterium]|nr:nucleotidyl transferase AbiEii/AbiGii toxin family protein [Bacteroidales bacterium]
MNREYAEKVKILLRLLPVVMDEKVFAVHGGSAINLFIKNLPRYSVDIDLTYIPLEGRDESLEHINSHLMNITDKAERAFRGIHIVPKMSSAELLCPATRHFFSVPQTTSSFHTMWLVPFSMPRRLQARAGREERCDDREAPAGTSVEGAFPLTGGCRVSDRGLR